MQQQPNQIVTVTSVSNFSQLLLSSVTKHLKSNPMIYCIAGAQKPNKKHGNKSTRIRKHRSCYNDSFINSRRTYIKIIRFLNRNPISQQRPFPSKLAAHQHYKYKLTEWKFLIWSGYLYDNYTTHYHSNTIQLSIRCLEKAWMDCYSINNEENLTDK